MAEPRKTARFFDTPGSLILIWADADQNSSECGPAHKVEVQRVRLNELRARQTTLQHHDPSNPQDDEKKRTKRHRY